MSSPTPDDVLSFWRDAGFERWFGKSDAFDARIARQFGALHERAAAGQLDDWSDTAPGALALVIVLDQFSRNLHRGSPRAYACDDRARRFARHALGAGFEQQIDLPMRLFFYLPFEHSESLHDQDRALLLLTAHARETGQPETLRAAHQHHDIIRRFGRFPHRNAVLGRASTPDEVAFLAGGGFAG